MKDGAVKAVQTEEMPETTRKHFDMAILAILGNVKQFCALAVMAENKRALLTLGQAVNEVINAGLEQIENPGKKPIEN